MLNEKPQISNRQELLQDHSRTFELPRPRYTLGARVVSVLQHLPHNIRPLPELLYFLGLTRASELVQDFLHPAEDKFIPVGKPLKLQDPILVLGTTSPWFPLWAEA